MRKLAAIMFTDIAGYSAMMSANEDLAMQNLEKIRKLLFHSIKRYNGEFIKEIGDGSLIIFNSSWDAVNCAIDIQKELSSEPSCRLRIGIHIGDIMLLNKDVFGDGVNIASRIQGLCEPGCIYISERVYDDIRNKSDIRAIVVGEKKLKNIDQPVKIYRIKVEGSDINNEIYKSKDINAIVRNIVEKVRPHSRLKKALWVSGLSLILIAIFFIIGNSVINAGEQKEPTPIAVISFENQTGDQNLDYLQKAIPNLIITNLEQSQMFRPMTWERMHDVMAQMGNTSGSFIDPATGIEICRKEGYPFIVVGSFVKAGDVFATDIKVLDVNSKQIITSFSSKGNGLASILESQVDDISKAISKSVGKEGQEVEQPRILDLATSSLTAYDLFLKGREAYEKMYFEDARKFLQQAVSIDSGFATALLYNAYACRSLGLEKQANNLFIKAFNASSRATEKEKLTIQAAYAGIIEKDSKKEISLLKELEKIAPDDKRVYFSLGKYYMERGPYDTTIKYFNKALELDPGFGEAANQLAYVYSWQENYEKAIEYLEKYSDLNPGDANPFDSMGDLYWKMGDNKKAIKAYRKSLQLKPDFYVSAAKLAYVYAMEENPQELYYWMNKSIEVAPNQNMKLVLNWCLAYFEYLYGKQRISKYRLDQLMKELPEKDQRPFNVGYNWLNAYMALDKQNYDEALKYNQAYLHYASISGNGNRFDSSGYLMMKGLICLYNNKTDSSSYYLSGIDQIINNSWYRFDFDYLKNEIDIYNARSANQLKKLIIKGRRLPMFSFPDIVIYNLPFRMNSLAEAYKRIGLTEKAIEEYERLVTFYTSSPERRLVNPLYYYRLAKLTEEEGNMDKAVEYYEKFLNLWNEADPELEELQDARYRLKEIREAIVT